MYITAWGYIDLSLHCWAQYRRFGPTTWITQHNWSDFNLAKCNDWVLQQWFCRFALLKQSIEVIHHIELKQSYCEIWESVPAVFGKLSWNFRPSLSVCSSLAGNRQYITGLSIYYRDMTCFDGLYDSWSWEAPWLAMQKYVLLAVGRLLGPSDGKWPASLD